MLRVVRTAVLLVGFGLGFGACFIEPAQPATFRFECEVSDECEADQACANSLCQTPCGPGLEACTGGSFCVNGFCSNLCPLDQDVCPPPQECVSLGLPGDEPGDEPPESGVCTVLCDPIERPCGEGQLCVAGFCADECETVADCGSAEACVSIGPDVGICVPAGSGGGFP